MEADEIDLMGCEHLCSYVRSAPDLAGARMVARAGRAEAELRQARRWSAIWKRAAQEYRWDWNMAIAELTHMEQCVNDLKRENRQLKAKRAERAEEEPDTFRQLGQALEAWRSARRNFPYDAAPNRTVEDRSLAVEDEIGRLEAQGWRFGTWQQLATRSADGHVSPNAERATANENEVK